MKAFALVLFLVVYIITTILVIAKQDAIASQNITIITCQVEGDGTVNNRSEVAYYNCGPRVAFMLVTDSPGELRMKSLLGKVVDLKVEPVQ